jgi:hypothetical protein
MPDDTTPWRGLQLVAILGGLLAIGLGWLSDDPPLGKFGALAVVCGVAGVFAGRR